MFDTVRNNDCEFGLSLLDATTGSVANPNIFTVVQPIFTSSFESPYIVSLTTPGRLNILAEDGQLAGAYPLELVAVYDTNL